MKKTKKIIAAAAAALMVAITVPTVSSAATYYPICNVANCNRTTNHRHNGNWYCGHTSNDGHSHHSRSTRGYGHHGSGHH